jgi:hypothetical protein
MVALPHPCYARVADTVFSNRTWAHDYVNRLRRELTIWNGLIYASQLQTPGVNDPISSTPIPSLSSLFCTQTSYHLSASTSNIRSFKKSTSEFCYISIAEHRQFVTESVLPTSDNGHASLSIHHDCEKHHRFAHQRRHS